MNKKGFTLVELLAVIVILGVVLTISISSISNVKKRTNVAMFSEKIEFSVAAAIKYYEEKDHKEVLSSSNQKITIQELIDTEYLKVDTEDVDGKKAILDSSRNKNNVNALTICVYTKYNRVYACVENTPANISSDESNPGLLYEITSTDYVSTDYICSTAITC